MVRLACISFPRFDLQVVALRHPEWKELPAAIVTDDRPLGRITAVNRAALAAGVEPGMRYAAALGICGELRAGTVDSRERDELRRRLITLLGAFSPQVEAAEAEEALFWVNASGLERIYETPLSWAEAVRASVEGDGLVCRIALGFTRFGTYAAAKAKRGITVFSSGEEEAAAAMRAPLGVLPIELEAMARCRQLGIVTIGGFCRFSSGALRRRFGPDVERLQSFARGEQELPIQAADAPALLRREVRLLYPQSSTDVLLHHQVSMLRELVAYAWMQQQLIGDLTLEFHPERWPGHREQCRRERIFTARPTRDQKAIERLLRLRLENLRLSGPVVRLSLEATLVPTDRVQEDLFATAVRRDVKSALAAIDEIRAELGNDAVQIAELVDAHLPQEQYRWRRVERFGPVPRHDGESPRRARLVRRALHDPPPLSRRAGRAAASLAGPYEYSGDWWRGPYRRDYYYLRDSSGRLLWVYRDAAAAGGATSAEDTPGRWFVQGIVE